MFEPWGLGAEELKILLDVVVNPAEGDGVSKVTED